MNKRIKQLTESIAADIFTLARNILDANDLRNSALKRDMQVKVRRQENPVIDVVFNDYLHYIEAGRKPRTGRMPRLSALRDWALEKGIPADNATLFLLARSIWYNGATPRPILASLEEEIGKRFSAQWSDKLFECIVQEVEKELALSPEM
ncbi:MAG: hypothetical protein LBR34_03490 [Prevotella sp.]|jgi:hypothetical protein|nr:hypothetical protein [Prevotella sp.]